jgi:orotidine-5'-phosphate decarboxylase
MGKKCELIFSLDASNRKDFLRWIDATQDTVDMYKIGLVPFTLLGNQAITILKKRNKKVFLDLKFFDIPNTMVKAALNAINHGVDMLDFHLSGQTESLRFTLENIRRQTAKKRQNNPIFIGITVLTSSSQDDKIHASVLELAEKACNLNFDGIVLSGQEAGSVRHKFKDKLILVCPGIRLTDSCCDQKRVVSPAEVRSLADYIVVGRPIYNSQDPGKAASQIKQELEKQ